MMFISVMVLCMWGYCSEVRSDAAFASCAEATMNAADVQAILPTGVYIKDQWCEESS